MAKGKDNNDKDKVPKKKAPTKPKAKTKVPKKNFTTEQAVELVTKEPVRRKKSPPKDSTPATASKPPKTFYLSVATKKASSVQKGQGEGSGEIKKTAEKKSKAKPTPSKTANKVYKKVPPPSTASRPSDSSEDEIPDEDPEPEEEEDDEDVMVDSPSSGDETPPEAQQAAEDEGNNDAESTGSGEGEGGIEDNINPLAADTDEEYEEKRLLIDLVHSYPELYDKANPNYLKRSNKIVWRHITQALGYDAYSDEAVKHVKLMWRNIRDPYRKRVKKTICDQKKSGSKGDYKETMESWKFHKELSFLRHYLYLDE